MMMAEAAACNWITVHPLAVASILLIPADVPLTCRGLELAAEEHIASNWCSIGQDIEELKD